MRGLLLREGLFTAVLAIPLGLVLGYLTARGCIHILATWFFPGAIPSVSLLSWPVIVAVIAVVLSTAILSLLGPMRQVAKISPIEAIRYQEKNMGKRAMRKGYAFLNPGRLSAANMSRNRRRTTVTILTMALGGILFLSVAGIVSSMDEMDYARKHLTKGSFMIDLRYSGNDETYPENNLNALQQTDIMGPDFEDAVRAIPGVTRVEQGHMALAYVHHDGYEEGKRFSVSAFTREDIATMDVKRGGIDYDAMLAQNGIVFSTDILMDEFGFKIGDTVNLTLFDGDRGVSFKGVLMASTYHSQGEFAVPQDILDQYITGANPTARFYVWVDGDENGAAYTQVKADLQALVDPDVNMTLISMDEELLIARSSMQMTAIALYMILGILGVVSFMNLINTMVTSIVTRRREIGTLQAIGLSNKQLGAMLWREGLTFTGGTLMWALTLGNMLGYLGFLWAKDAGLMGLTHYHYPLAETVVMVLALVIGQFIVTRLLSRYAHKDSLVQRIQV
jgi:putative ABC transport system permease protein